MKMLKAILFLAALLSLFFVEDSNSQIRINLSSQNYYDDNIYNNYYKVEDFVTGITYGSGYDYKSENNNFQVYYIGNYNYYQKNILKTNYTHKIGLVNTTLFADDGNPLNAGINLIVRNNRDFFSLYDSRQFSFYVNYNQTFAGGNNLLLGYFLSKNDYYNLSSFSHYENKFFAKATISFETKTSLMLGSEIDYKSYLEKSFDPTFANNNSQMGLYINLSQSLSEKTGIAFYTLARFSLLGGTRYIGDSTFIYYEEEMLNTLYSNEGMEYGLSLTHLINSELSFSTEVNYKTRQYTNLPVADIEGNSLGINRSDKEIVLGIGLDYRLNSLFEGLGVILNYSYILNKSNDLFYDFDNQLFLIGFDWDL